jgi:hypothetical protein
VCSSGGRTDLRKQHSWVLNSPEGIKIANGLTLKAAMQYRIVKDERQGMGPFRVTTDGYLYSVEDKHDQELFSWHWHPLGSSPHKDPHAHFADNVISLQGAFLSRAPMPTGRTTFEEFVRYVIQALEVEPLCEDWVNRLALAEGPHKLYRSWHQTPAERGDA